MHVTTDFNFTDIEDKSEELQVGLALHVLSEMGRDPNIIRLR